MPWKEITRMSQRKEFIAMVKAQVFHISELCRRFSVSRKTGYKWLQRYAQEGEEGLKDRSRRPHNMPNRLPPQTEAQIVRLRDRYGTWGARKIRKRLEVEVSPVIPACSTITAVLHRQGRINPEGPGSHHNWKRFEHPAPNCLWQMDFRSPVRTLAGAYQPLTILDDCSRFNLCLQALDSQRLDPVREALSHTFRRYGLPDALLMDNGTPWGGHAETPYTALTVWLLRLPVRVLHSRPYHPQTLGKDERFHRTLNQELISRYQWRDQLHLQSRFDTWRFRYNFERPHDALGLETPSSRYYPSPRSFPEALPLIEYPSATYVRKVQSGGWLHFKGYTLRVGKAFQGYPMGIQPTPVDGVFEIFFGQQRIAQVDLLTLSKT